MRTSLAKVKQVYVTWPSCDLQRRTKLWRRAEDSLGVLITWARIERILEGKAS